MTDDEALPDEDELPDEACLNCGWAVSSCVRICTCGYCEDCLEDMVPEAIAAHQEHCGPDEDTDPRRMGR